MDDVVPQEPALVAEDTAPAGTPSEDVAAEDAAANPSKPTRALMGTPDALPFGRKRGIAGLVRPPGRPGRIPALAWGLALAGLCVGLAIGVLVMRHRRDAQAIVAAVNGSVISKDALFSRLQQTAGVPVMHKIVEEDLQLQFAQKKGVPATDAQVEARYQQMSRDSRFAASLAASGLSEDAYKSSLRVKIAQANVLTQGITVSDAEARAFYAAQSDPRNPQAQFYKPETISLRAISTATQPAAQRAMQELAANTPFELAASEYSMDPSKANGGRIAPLQRGRSPLAQVPSLEQALFGMKVGQLYGPISFNKAWWIFRCEDKTLGQSTPFDAVKDESRLGAAIVKGTRLNGKAIQAEFQQFERGSNLQAFWPQYQQAVTGR